MQALYTEQHLSDLKGQIRRRGLALLGLLLAAVAAIVWLLIIDDHKENRPELAITLVLIISGCALIFLYDLLVHPLRAYEKHIDSALHGRFHESSLVFDRINEESSVVDGVVFQDMIFLGDPDKHGDRERMFYWDRELPLPAFSRGQEVTLRYYDKFITGYQD